MRRSPLTSLTSKSYIVAPKVNYPICFASNRFTECLRDLSADAFRRAPQRIIVEMRVALCRGALRVTQQLTNDRQAKPGTGSY